VRELQNPDLQTSVAAIFWEGMSVGNAVRRLLKLGFSDQDVCAIGVLSGRAPDLEDFFASHCIPPADTSYFNDCFKDGGIVLIIQTPTEKEKRRALEVVRRSGGILPPSHAVSD